MRCCSSLGWRLLRDEQASAGKVDTFRNPGFLQGEHGQRPPLFRAGPLDFRSRVENGVGFSASSPAFGGAPALTAVTRLAAGSAASASAGPAASSSMFSFGVNSSESSVSWRLGKSAALGNSSGWIMLHGPFGRGPRNGSLFEYAAGGEWCPGCEGRPFDCIGIMDAAIERAILRPSPRFHSGGFSPFW